LMLKNSLGLGGGLRKTWRIPSSSSAIRLSLRLPSPVLPWVGRVLGEPEDDERGDDGAFGDVVPVVGDAVQLRLNPVPLPAPPRELLELVPGLPGLLPGPPPPPCCSSRIRKSLRLLSRAIRDIPPRPAGGGDAVTSSLKSISNELVIIPFSIQIISIFILYIRYLRLRLRAGIGVVETGVAAILPAVPDPRLFNWIR
jgi:hypothetical protein